MKRALLLLLLLAACKAQPAPGAAAGAPASPPLQPPAATPAGPRQPLVIFLGDSLTAGLGLAEDQAFPALLARRLGELGSPIRLVNAGVSGDTSAGGLRRIDWLLRQKPDVVVVGLGANDALRGADPTEIEHNLREIVVHARAGGARVLLLGMRIPPNYGGDYAGRFAAIYPRIAREMDVPLVPFLLEGVGGDPALNQADGIHPTAQGQERVAKVILPYLRDVLSDTAAARRAK
ncbi:MAG TPA: arylesterase [Thermoanaerobaculia bacterium]|nr:arylesterase [Thermoanaerobaculia bacterium]